MASLSLLYSPPLEKSVDSPAWPLPGAGFSLQAVLNSGEIDGAEDGRATLQNARELGRTFYRKPIRNGATTKALARRLGPRATSQMPFRDENACKLITISNYNGTSPRDPDLNFFTQASSIKCFTYSLRFSSNLFVLSLDRQTRLFIAAYLTASTRRASSCAPIFKIMKTLCY